ncbi:Two-component sensor histidine kinase, contains HisKA and HATPase domains [Sphingobium faniae]|nr:Two-component sensor histidine kinase, contains HisKA and HATPase domains [Sphingobium faniae]
MQRRNDRFVERLPLVPGQRWLGYFGATAFCLGALSLRLAVTPLLGKGAPFSIFFPAVLLSTFLFGARPGMAAAALGLLFGSYFFLLPATAFTITPGLVFVMLLYVVVTGVAVALIHFMQRVNFRLAVERERSRELAETKDLLFRELQHRVSNNLQVIAALLALQRGHIEDDAARRALDDASARLALVGKISRAMYHPSGEGQDVGAFLTALCGDIVEASGRQDVAVHVTAPRQLLLSSHVSVPLALIVAEAVSNAIEHGMPDRAGTVGVSLEASDEGFSLRVVDDGKGIAQGKGIGASNSLGLRIATALAAQLGGRFRLESGDGGGAVARLDLPPSANGTAE